MCVSKIDSKTLEKICKEAIEADKTPEEKEVRSYEGKKREKHYESEFSYEYVDWRGKIPYIPGPNEKIRKKKYEPIANGQTELDGT